MDLQRVIHDLASCIQRIDARCPQAANARTGVSYQAGIGPHPETQAVALIAKELPLLDAAYASIPGPADYRSQKGECQCARADGS